MVVVFHDLNLVHDFVDQKNAQASLGALANDLGKVFGLVFMDRKRIAVVGELNE